MTSGENAKKHKLTVYLIKEGYDEIDSFLSIDGFNRINVSGESGNEGVLVYKGGFRSKPTWVSIFESLPGFDSASIWNQSSKAILILKYKNRFVCFTFGYAKHLIDELAYERNFGLIVALNLSDPNAIKSIDKTNIGHIALHSKEQATKDLDLASFEFDYEVDLLKSITGKSEPSGEGDRETLSGRDSVSIYTRVMLDDFYAISERLYEAFNNEKYKDAYPWIDKISEVRDSEVLGHLDDKVSNLIAERDFDLIWLAIPEVVVWEDIRGFSYKRKGESPTRPGPVLYQDLDIAEWVSRVAISDDLTSKQLKSKKIYIYWQDGRPPSSWSVYRCLNAEIKLNNKTYILNDSVWYYVESSFVIETENYFESVPDAPFVLPNYGVDKEPEYLARVAKDNPVYALMDRKEIMIGGGGVAEWSSAICFR